MLWLWPPADCKRQVPDALAASYFHIGVGGYGALLAALILDTVAECS